jgi:hypothetical protein
MQFDRLVQVLCDRFSGLSTASALGAAAAIAMRAASVVNVIHDDTRGWMSECDATVSALWRAIQLREDGRSSVSSAHDRLADAIALHCEDLTPLESAFVESVAACAIMVVNKGAATYCEEVVIRHLSAAQLLEQCLGDGQQVGRAVGAYSVLDEESELLTQVADMLITTLYLQVDVEQLKEHANMKTGVLRVL